MKESEDKALCASYLWQRSIDNHEMNIEVALKYNKALLNLKDLFLDIQQTHSIMTTMPSLIYKYILEEEKWEAY